MSAAASVILILGAGPGVGQSVARAFAAKGYKVALTSRKAKTEENTANQINISADLSNSEGVAEVFSKVKATFGPPSVVVYNASAGTFDDAKDPLAVPLDAFVRNLNINTVSAYAAAQQAALAFKQLPDDASRTFIYTGNITNTAPLPRFMDSSAGKSATASILQSAAAGYGDQGFKFYYADERTETGAPMYKGVSGEAHGEFYLQLAEGHAQGPWQQTFVKGQGYKHFSINN